MTAQEKTKTKETITKLHTKYYGKKPRKDLKAKKIETVLKARKEVKKQQRQACKEANPAGVGTDDQAKTTTITTPQGTAVIGDTRPTVAQLRKTAKAEGIKYANILTKDELIAVLCHKTEDNQAEINKIIEAAQKRWKAGWGSKSPAATKTGGN